MYLGGGQCVEEVALVGEDQQGDAVQLLLIQQLTQLHARLAHALAVRRVDHVDLRAEKKGEGASGEPGTRGGDRPRGMGGQRHAWDHDCGGERCRYLLHGSCPEEEKWGWTCDVTGGKLFHSSIVLGWCTHGLRDTIGM